MSALQASEAAPFPCQTQNLTPPKPFETDPELLNVFTQKKIDAEQARRRAEIAKALAQEAARWELNSIELEARKRQAAAQVAEILELPVRAS